MPGMPGRFVDRGVKSVVGMYGHTYSKGKDQPGKVANPARGQLNRENEYLFPCPHSRLRIWSRETGSAVPSRASLLISIPRLRESGAYLRDSSRVPRRRYFFYVNLTRADARKFDMRRHDGKKLDTISLELS